MESYNWENVVGHDSSLPKAKWVLIKMIQIEVGEKKSHGKA